MLTSLSENKEIFDIKFLRRWEVAEKKLFKGIIITNNGEKIEYFRRAANENEAYHLIKKKYNYDHDKEPWAFVKMEIVEVK